MTDAISKAFQNVAPSDIITTLGEHFFEHSPGPEDFKAFLSRHLYSIRYAFVAGDGTINPVAALSDGRTERLFAADDDETLHEMLQRITTVAQATGSTRFFFSRLVPVTMSATDRQLDEDETTWKASLLWFAEDKVDGERKQGTIEVIGGTLGDKTNAPALGGLIGDWLHAVLA